jgi:hypothetical protein
MTSGQLNRPAARRVVRGKAPDIKQQLNTDQRGPDECWPWLGNVGGRGYGRFTLKGKAYRPHRVALERRLGRVLGPNEVACHTCDNPLCCNPAHLFAGTVADNVADMVAKGQTRRW